MLMHFAPYEPRLSTASDELELRLHSVDATQTLAPDLFNHELTEVRIVDALGRTLYHAKQSTLSRAELAELLLPLTPGIYHLQVAAVDGRLFSQTFAHVR